MAHRNSADKQEAKALGPSTEQQEMDDDSSAHPPTHSDGGRRGRFLEAILSSTSDSVIAADAQGRITAWNPAAEVMFGYSAEEALGRSLTLIVPERLHSAHAAGLQNFVRTGRVRLTGGPVTVPAARRNGEEFPVEFSLCRWEWGDEIGFGVILRDVRARLEAESRCRLLFESSRDAILTLEPPDWRFTSANPAAVRLFRARDEAHVTAMFPRETSPEQQPDGRLSQEAAGEAIAAAMQTGTNLFEWTHRDADGRAFLADVLLTRLEINGRPLLQATVRDITTKRTMEVQLLHAQKLEAIGQLAAGIAHEINTPAQYVSDNVAFLSKAFTNLLKTVETCRSALSADGTSLEPETREAVNKSLRDGQIDFLASEVPHAIAQSTDGMARVASIVAAMKEFSHPSLGVKEPVDILQALDTTLTVARNEWKYVAEIETDFDLELGPVPALRDELNQVFLNVIVNAAHAVSDATEGGSRGLGKIRVQTRRVGSMAEIRIADSGAGIPEHIMHRIFEPFFTTKAVGKGTGQGLAIARSVVVDKHGGTIRAESELGKGTVMIISLPIVLAAGQDTGGEA